jgi:hypothetical protein
MKNKNCCIAMLNKISFIFLFSFTVVADQSFAQDTIQQKTATKKWSFLAELYLMFPNMSGGLGIGELPEATVSATPGDIFSKLQIGAMLFLEARNDKWAINSDVIYMDLSQEAEPGTVIKSGEVSAQQFALEIAGLRKVLPWLEIGVAGLVNAVNSDVAFVVDAIGPGPATTAKSGSISQTWVDPMIVARIKSAEDKKLIYQFRGELGGFGVGSAFAWQALANVGYRFTKLFHMTAGYRFISLDYETGSGQAKFVYDMDTFGPEVRLGFSF